MRGRDRPRRPRAPLTVRRTVPAGGGLGACRRDVAAVGFFGTCVTFALSALLLFPVIGGAQEIRLSGQPTCAECEVRIADRLQLGSREDTLVGVPGMVRAAMDGSGKIYVISDLQPMASVPVYDGKSGDLVRMLGRRGQGPGEFSRVSRLTAGSTHVYLQDVSGRIHVFDVDGAFEGTLNQVPPPRMNLSLIEDTILVVVGAQRARHGSSNRDVHLFDAGTGQFLRELGPPSEFGPSGGSATVRVAEASPGSVWLVHPPDRLTNWSLEGERSSTIRWARDWLEHVSPRYRGSSADDGYVLHDLWSNPHTGLLWVASVVDDPDYTDPHPPPVPGQPMDPGRFAPMQMNAAKQTIISVVDPNRGDVVAHLEINEAAYEFLGDGRLVVMQEADDGLFQWVELLTLELVGTSF